MTELSRQKGLTLVEVMVAMFVLAVGILGIIGLQLFAKQNNYDAIQRTTAANLASTIVERMRANNTALGGYLGSAEPVNPATAIPAGCTEAAPCTPAQLAAVDRQYWHSMLVGQAELDADDNTTGGLVVPSACITRDPNGVGNTNEYRIAIAWRGRTALTNPTISTCGEGAAGNPYGANNEFRRILVIDARID